MDKQDRKELLDSLNGMSEDSREEIKDIIMESLEESGLKAAADKLTETPRMTREEILAVKNTQQRQQLIRENMDLFVN